MRLVLGCVVEGHGDVDAVPVLVRRLVVRIRPEVDLSLPRPVRTSRQRLVKEGELERAVALAANKAGPSGGVLVLIDADDDCPALLGRRLLDRARRRLASHPVSVVLAKREFESWLVAAAPSLGGRRGLRADLEAPEDPESIRDAKGWLAERMPPGRRYRETLDQEALAAVVDIDAAHAAPSFVKFVREVESLVDQLCAPCAGL
jgi:hypothetical protein